MPLIFKYFWFIGAAFMLVNIAIWRHRLVTIVGRGTVSKSEADHFINWIAAWLVGGPFLLGIIAAVAGWSSPLCAGILIFDTVPKTLASLLTLAGWAAILWWVWRGTGADFLARVGPALRRRPSYDKHYSPAHVRVIVTALVLTSGVGAAIAWRTMPANPSLTCPATIAAR